MRRCVSQPKPPLSRCAETHACMCSQDKRRKDRCTHTHTLTSPICATQNNVEDTEPEPEPELSTDALAALEQSAAAAVADDPFNNSSRSCIIESLSTRSAGKKTGAKKQTAGVEVFGDFGAVRKTTFVRFFLCVCAEPVLANRRFRSDINKLTAKPAVCPRVHPHRCCSVSTTTDMDHQADNSLWSGS
jgi:hypothetical protein